MLLETIGLGFTLFFMLIGLIGAFIPLIPGALLVWLTALSYALVTGFAQISGASFAAMTMIALVSVTSDLWVPLLGAKAGGAGARSLLWGMAGATVGFLVTSLPGALVGYACGILWSEYRKHGDFGLALRASLTGLAGWGLSALVEASGALVMIGIFLRNVLR